MQLWVDGKSETSAGRAIRATVKEQVAEINKKAASRGVRAVNAMRNAELRVLKGQRSGKVYRRPYTKKATYTASAPGEAPARRTGNLRMHWNGQVRTAGSSDRGIQIVAELESQEKYAAYLEDGTDKMEARPFVEKIKEQARPEIEKIYKESYS